jgi:hypothetical protein
LHHQLPCGNPIKKAWPFSTQVWGLFSPLHLWLKLLGMIVLEVGTFLSSYLSLLCKVFPLVKIWICFVVNWMINWKNIWPFGVWRTNGTF